MNMQSKAVGIVVEVLKYGIVAFLILSGGAKLVGVDEMVELYQSIGFGQWFRYASGAVEILAAVFLVFPSLRLAGILLAAGIMGVGIAEHILALGIIPGTPAVLFGVVLIILFLKRPRAPFAA